MPGETTVDTSTVEVVNTVTQVAATMVIIVVMVEPMVGMSVVILGTEEHPLPTSTDPGKFYRMT